MKKNNRKEYKKVRTNVSLGSNIISESRYKRKVVIITKDEERGKFASKTVHEVRTVGGDWKQSSKPKYANHSNKGKISK